MNNRFLAYAVTAATACSLLAAGIAPAQAADDRSGWSFQPLAASANGLPLDAARPWVVPAGFTQKVVTDETSLDVYPGGNDWHDMNTQNETGRSVGRYLYTTHEVRGAENASNGSVTVTDLKTGRTTLLAQRLDWDALDGIRWTPWGTLLVTEETDTGLLWEITLDRRDPSVATSVKARPALGMMSQEGVDVAPDGSLIVIDEFRGGAIYRFVPDRKNDLRSGRLYALSVADGGSGLDTGKATWVLLDRDAVQVGARAAVAAANAAGAGISTFQRPEDVEIIGNTVYVAVTEAEPQAQAAGAASGDGRVVAIDLKRSVVSDFVRGGLNVAAERAGVTGLKNPDNVAEGPDGRLWIVEDNTASDIWATTPDGNKDGAADKVSLFASLTDAPAEGTGIYFSLDGRSLFVNIQHSGTGNDKTIAITPRHS